MNKLDLAENIAQELNVSKAESLRMIESLMANVSRELKAGRHVTLSGFGRFSTYQRKSRNGRNPQTGKDLKIPSRRVVKFSVGSELKAAVDKRK